MILSVIIFRQNKIIHKEVFHNQDKSIVSTDLMAFSPKSSDESSNSDQLLMGMLSGVTGMVSMLSGGTFSRFESFSTPEYRLDYYESLTGYTFVVLSSPSLVESQIVQKELEKLYSLLFVPLVIRNPLFNPTQLTGSLLDSHCDVFISELRNQFQFFNPNMYCFCHYFASIS